MQFSRIRLENWRNFGEVDVPVATRVFLVGANASGKSNFLDALRFLHDLVISGGGFEKAVQDRGGVIAIRNLAARRETDVAIEVEIGDDNCCLWRYRIVFNQDDRHSPVLKEEEVWSANDELILQRPNDADRNDEELLGQTHLEQNIANQKFREVKEFFESIRYFHIVPQLVREPERTTAVLREDPYGSDFLDRVSDTHASTRKARLTRIQKVLRSVVPQLSGIELWIDRRGTPHLRGKYEHWRKRGTWQTEKDFSDGTLRIIGLLWALQDGEGPLLLEEPELSLHSAIVMRLPQLLYAIQRSWDKPMRQFFVSTHSPELLVDEGIGAHETLLLHPSKNGTEVYLCAEIDQFVNELNAGLTMADVVIMRTQPNDLVKLTLL